MRQVADGVPTLQHTWVIDDGDLTSVSERGAEVEDSGSRRVSTRPGATASRRSSTPRARPDGRRGASLTHDNFLGLAENAIAKLGDVVARDGASTLLFLPLAHVFARFIEVLCVTAEAKMGHSADIANILDDFQAFQPSLHPRCPRVFEKIYNKANETATADGKGAIFGRAADTAVAYSEALDKGSVPLGLKIKYAVFDSSSTRSLRTKMGGWVQYAVSGGAPWAPVWVTSSAASA